MQVVQTMLKRPSETGVIQMMTWLPVDARVRCGSVITLKNETERWQVAEQFSQEELGSIQTKWGLELPKSQRTER